MTRDNHIYPHFKNVETGEIDNSPKTAFDWMLKGNHVQRKWGPNTDFVDDVACYCFCNMDGKPTFCIRSATTPCKLSSQN